MKHIKIQNLTIYDSIRNLSYSTLIMDLIETSTIIPSRRSIEKTLKIVLIALSGLLIAKSVYNPSVGNIHSLLIFGFIASMPFGCLFLPKGPIQGPFTLLWKSISGLCLFYFGMLLYLFFQEKSQATNFIATYIDSNLAFINYEQVSYAQDCSLINHQKPNPLQNLYHACFDLFALAHFLGWFFKTLICRDIKLIFFASVTFEMIQYSFRNVLNNFKQCWWDHVIIDIFGCNLLGIACGFFVIDKFGLNRYKWSLRFAPLKHSHWENMKRFWKQWDVSKLQIIAFSSLRPYLKCVLFIILFQANDLTLFFLKYVYQIPPSHFLCIGRVWLVGLLCVNATKQYYDFLKDRSKFRRVNLLLLLGIVMTQIAIVLKQGQNSFQHAYVDTLGIIFLGSLIIIFLALFIKIGISDILRKGKVFIEKRKAIKSLEKERAKLIREQ